MKPFLFLALCLWFALPARASTDPFAGFRIPAHSWQSGSMSAGFSAARNHEDMRGAYSHSNWLYSTLQSGLAGGWDSDALQYGYDLDLDGRLENRHSREGYTATAYRSERDVVDRVAAEYWNLAGSLRSYPFHVPVGLGISAVASGGYVQEWDRADERTGMDSPEVRQSESRGTSASHSYQTRLRAEVFAGLGRVRDASVVYAVHVLEERLTATGALTRPLSAQAREKLAALQYVAPFYAQAHERPDRHVWRDLERILREDGALRGDGLDAYSVLRALEPIAPAGRPTRQRGWFVGVVGGGTTEYSIVRSEWQRIYQSYLDGNLESALVSDGSLRFVESYDQALLGGQAEYHLPAGWRWQFDASTRFTCPVRAGEKGLSLSSRASAGWFVSDRWAANASLQQYRSYFAPDGAGGRLMEDRWATSASASIEYFLEDRTSLSLAFAEQQERVAYPSVSWIFRRQGRVSLGIRYRFLGRLDAPGLIEPVRLAR
jgi:hypothetical protein